MKAMGTDEQVFDNKYYDWTGNQARRSQRLRNKKSKKTIRRLKDNNEIYI
jgi:hypothetical protein